MRKVLSAIWPVLFIFLLTLFFFSPIFKGQMPFPGDTLIGGYYPWRGLSWQNKATEYPLKNITIADATSQFYPWRYLAVKLMKQGKLPLWNNYEFSGTPLLAVPSTAALYPLNFFFFIFPFNTAWTILVVLQPLLGGIFFYLFLRNKKLSKIASLLGSICFSFGSYFLLSSEFNVLGHTAFWFPLGLLAVDKLFQKPRFVWFLVLTASLVMSILAGFVQFVFYGYILLGFYIAFRTLRYQKIFKKTLLLTVGGVVFSALLSAVQLLPFINLLRESGRVEAYGDINVITRFFIPLRQLTMFFSPDFFGNPATANYWGEHHYYEFCGYFGVTAVLFVFYLIFSKKFTRETIFWLSVSFASLFLAVKTPISLLPYNLKVPLLSSFVPARLLFFASFSFSTLAAIGFDSLYKDFRLKNRKRSLINLILSFVFLAFILLCLWTTAFFFEKQIISMRNLVLPTFYLFLTGFILAFSYFGPRKKLQLFFFFILLLISFDLYRQGRKFLPFIDTNLVYPEVETTEFLRKNLDQGRFIPLHQEIFGTNHQTVYGLEGAEGYNPIHSRKYSFFVAQGREKTPSDYLSTHFERTVYGRRYKSNVFKLLSVKYFLSFDDLDESENYPLVFSEGKTKIYENKKALPRVFLACHWEKKDNPLEIMNGIISQKNPAEKVFLEKDVGVSCKAKEKLGEAKIADYSSGRIEIDSMVPESRILVFSDIYYPGWRVFIDENKGELLKVDYVLKGVVVPAGEHTVRFIYDPLSFKIGLYLSFGTLILLIAGGIGIYKFKKEWW